MGRTWVECGYGKDVGWRKITQDNVGWETLFILDIKKMARKKKNNSKPDSQDAKGERRVRKVVNGQEISSKKPDMSQVKYTKKQIGYRKLFSKAAEYAQSVVNDPVKKREYQKKIHNDKRKRGTSVYHTALKDFMALHSQKVDKVDVQIIFQKYQEKYQLSEREATAIKYLIAQGSLTNATYQRITDVSKATATRDLQGLISKGLISAPAKGAGAVYTLIPLPKQ